MGTENLKMSAERGARSAEGGPEILLPSSPFRVPSSKDRFSCPCCNENLIDPRVVELVERIEEDIQERLPVTSGYRCPAHNVAVGGKSTSSHPKGLACDLACTASRTRFRLIGAAIKQGITRIGVGKTYVHLDIDRQKDARVIWLY